MVAQWNSRRRGDSFAPRLLVATTVEVVATTALDGTMASLNGRHDDIVVNGSRTTAAEKPSRLAAMAPWLRRRSCDRRLTDLCCSGR